jgi:hypothetical protein
MAVSTAAFGLIGGGAGVAGLLEVLFAVGPLLLPAPTLARVPTVLPSPKASEPEFGFASGASPMCG